MILLVFHKCFFFACFIPVVESMKETLEKMIDGVRIGDEL